MNNQGRMETGSKGIFLLRLSLIKIMGLKQD